MLKRSLIFVAVCLFSALIAWLGGYDFDSRNFFVAYWTVLTVIAALGAVAVVASYEA